METKKEKDMLECKLNNFINMFLVQPINKYLIHPISKCFWQPMKKIFLKPVKSFFKNVIWILIFAGLGVLFLFSAKAYKNDKEKITDIQKQQNEISQKFEQNMNKVLVLKSKINGVKANDSLQKIWESELYNNEKEMLDLKKELNENHEESEAEIQSLWIHQLEYFAALIALIVAVVFFKTLDEKAKEKIQEEISKITGKKLDVISSNYDEYVRHKNLKKDAKILVLNEKDTKLPYIFKKVMQFFGENSNTLINQINLDGLSDYENHLDKLKEADVVVIENQVSDKEWKLPHKRLTPNYINDLQILKKQRNAHITLMDILENKDVNNNRMNIVQDIFPDFSKRKCSPIDIAILLVKDSITFKDCILKKEFIKKDLLFDIRMTFNKMDKTELLNKVMRYLKWKKDNLEKEIEEMQNAIMVIKLANDVCSASNGKTSVFYFGKGQFPVDLVNPAYQHLVSFANAPSQLYGNLLNMLKFKYELEKS